MSQQNNNVVEFTIQADKKKLFDALQKMKGDTSSLGTRIVQSLLGGEVHFSDALGMDVYGVKMTVTEHEKTEGP